MTGGVGDLVGLFVDPMGLLAGAFVGLLVSTDETPEFGALLGDTDGDLDGFAVGALDG